MAHRRELPQEVKESDSLALKYLVLEEKMIEKAREVVKC